MSYPKDNQVIRTQFVHKVFARVLHLRRFVQLPLRSVSYIMDDYNNLVISDIGSLLLLSKTQIQENQDFIVSSELLRCYLLFMEMHYKKPLRIKSQKSNILLFCKTKTFNLDFRNMIILFCCVIENPYYTRAVKNICLCIFSPISYYNEDQKLLETHQMCCQPSHSKLIVSH